MVKNHIRNIFIEPKISKHFVIFLFPKVFAMASTMVKTNTFLQGQLADSKCVN